MHYNPELEFNANTNRYSCHSNSHILNTLNTEPTRSIFTELSSPRPSHLSVSLAPSRSLRWLGVAILSLPPLVGARRPPLPSFTGGLRHPPLPSSAGGRASFVLPCLPPPIGQDTLLSCPLPAGTRHARLPSFVSRPPVLPCLHPPTCCATFLFLPPSAGTRRAPC